MLKWVYGYPADLSGEAEDIVTQAYERFIRTLGKAGLQITERFHNVGELLYYLKKCVISAIQDYRRCEARKARVLEQMQQEEAERARSVSDDDWLELVCHQQQLRKVQEWLRADVTDPQERQLIELLFRQSLTPAQVVAQFPGQFKDAHTVNRMRERIIKRGQRALLDA